MPYFISKPTRRELQERLAESAAKSELRNVRGELRTTEEAHDVQRRVERETGEAFTLPYAVSKDAPESKQAERELLERGGIRPEQIEEYQARSGRRD